MFLSTAKPNLHFHSYSPIYPSISPSSSTVSHLSFLLCPSLKHDNMYKNLRLNARSRESDLEPERSSSLCLDSKPKAKTQHQKAKDQQIEDEDCGRTFPTTIPKKPRRGRRSEAAAVEDFMRDSLEQTFASIRQQNSEILKDKEHIMKEKIGGDIDSNESGDDNDDNEGNIKGKKMVVEEDNPDWPLDADVGWGIRASEYFQQHPIRNVVGEDGVEIDWEGEIEDNWVKEINCLEWETFAFHPSPLIVLVFERYNQCLGENPITGMRLLYLCEIIASSHIVHRATDNWKVLKELERATKVYWSAKDRLPPRAVKIDINIERDLAYALKIKECPQILFLRGNRILYREKEFRTSDELVQMIAHFYYKAKKPSWMSGATLY